MATDSRAYRLSKDMLFVWAGVHIAPVIDLSQHIGQGLAKGERHAPLPVGSVFDRLDPMIADRHIHRASKQSAKWHTHTLFHDQLGGILNRVNSCHGADKG